MVVKTVWFASLELTVTSPVPPITRVASKKSFIRARNRPAADTSFVVGHEVAGGDQADTELSGRLHEGVGDGDDVAGVYVGERREDQCVVLASFERLVRSLSVSRSKLAPACIAWLCAAMNNCEYAVEGVPAASPTSLK